MTAPATDIIDDLIGGVVAIFDTHPDVVAITGRGSKNIVAWNPEATVVLPVYAYQFIDADEQATDGDTRSALFQITASADEEGTIRTMLGVAERILTQEEFAALSPPLDAFVERRIRRGFNLDVTLNVRRLSPVPV